MSVSGLEAWKAPENQSKNSQNPKSCNFNAHCEKTKNHSAGGFDFARNLGPLSSLRCPFHALFVARNGQTWPHQRHGRVQLPQVLRQLHLANTMDVPSGGNANSWNLMVIWIHMKSHDNEAPRWTFWRCEDANPNFEDMNLRKLPWEWIMGKDDMMSLDAVMEMANWTFEMQVFKFSVLGCPFLKTKCFSSSMTKLLYFQAV